MMKKWFVMTACLGVLLSSAAQAETCLDTEKLMQLDAQYEHALQVGNIQFLDKLLAPEFYWVHNLASLKEDKAALIARVKQPTEQAKQTAEQIVSRVDNVKAVINDLGVPSVAKLVSLGVPRARDGAARIPREGPQWADRSVQRAAAGQARASFDAGAAWR